MFANFGEFNSFFQASSFSWYLRLKVMEVSSGIFTLDAQWCIKNEKLFQRLKTSNASGLLFDLKPSCKINVKLRLYISAF